MTNEEKIFYNMLKGGATPEDITKAMTSAQKELDKERKEAEEKAKKQKEYDKQLELIRDDLIYDIGEYLNILCPDKYPEDRDDQKWDELYKSIESILKTTEKSIKNPKKSVFDFDFFDLI